MKNFFNTLLALRAQHEQRTGIFGSEQLGLRRFHDMLRRLVAASARLAPGAFRADVTHCSGADLDVVECTGNDLVAMRGHPCPALR